MWKYEVDIDYLIKDYTWEIDSIVNFLVSYRLPRRIGIPETSFNLAIF